jgi:signal transduction histidine kinase
MASLTLLAINCATSPKPKPYPKEKPMAAFYEQLDHARLVRLIDISRRLNSATTIDELLQLIISEAASLIHAEAASLLLLDAHTRVLRFRAVSGPNQEQFLGMRVPLKGSIAGEILESNKPLIVPDVREHESWNANVDAALGFSTSAILGVPMHDGLGRGVGVLEAINKLDGSEFGEDDIAVLSTLADLAGTAVAKAQLFNELEKAYRQLNDLDRLKSDFIALASHELRTPLSVILGYVSFLREEADEATASQLDSVLNAAVHLRSLIQDMVNLRYVDAGEAKLQPRQVNIGQLLYHVARERRETAEAKKQTLRLLLPQEPLTVLGDPGMLELVFGNLLGNAIKFTGTGGWIIIGAARRGDEVWVYVRDTGIGIPPEELERIFDRFYQVQPHMRRDYEGMGIGLSIVKDLVQLHHGRIWAHSTVDEGSEFFVALPS